MSVLSQTRINHKQQIFIIITINVHLMVLSEIRSYKIIMRKLAFWLWNLGKREEN